jgi:putative spermidine/putrescine transport system ATP-binding protein
MQRVALARALAAEPRLLLLDEPFSSLDENLRDDMRSLVKDLHERFGMTTIMVTHDRDEAFSMADRIALMFNGRIVQTGKPVDVYENPADEQVIKYFGKWKMPE